MRYFWTFFWSFFLVEMLAYVVSSMKGAEFDFVTAAVISVVVSIFVFIVGAVIPNQPVEKH
ncbi:YjzD family protein [Neobacillus sp. OS1-32]|uniref:YjzD family protein n=1 Tax=Neobacillus paridis TaxID=2803862 RepID=A0ABS1TR42_9BACI|nr:MULTISPECIES: YjzD family protein [Neobacillus]MBL4952380.1 YjzD family protein [Neobacillus paridis]WML32088.1 YjzD family protein [Neobacillus sp. OS1-32]